MKTEKRLPIHQMFGEDGYLKNDLLKSPHSVQRYVMMLEKTVHRYQTEVEEAKGLECEHCEPLEDGFYLG